MPRWAVAWFGLCLCLNLPARASDAPPPPARADLQPQERALLIVGGAERWVSAADAVAAGYTLVDLGDDWTPYIFQEVTDGNGNLMANRYRQVYLGLANDLGDRDGQPLAENDHNYLELFGVPPTLSVLRARFLDSQARAESCNGVDFEKLRAAVSIPPRTSKAEAKVGADYFPLLVGDSWTYRNTEEGGYTLKVLSEEPHEGGQVRYVVELLSGVKINDVYSKTAGWVLFHAEKFPEHEGLEATYEPPKQYLPNPLVAGQKWEWTGKDPTQVEHHESSRVVGFENVRVAAGKFRAMKVVSEITGGGAPLTRTNWYAAGVGLVKSATVAGQLKYGSELADYSFKKKPAK